MANETCNCTLAPKAMDWWLTETPDQLVTSCPPGEFWPWAQLTPKEWKELWQRYHDLRQYGDRFRILFSIDFALCALGIAGNAMSLITLSSESFKQPSYVYHRAIATFDLVFNLLFVAHAGCYVNNDTVVRSYIGSVLRHAIKGPLFSFSLISDIIAIFVAFERMMAVKYPVKYKTINKNTFAVLAAVISAAIGLANRFHYSVLDSVNPIVDPATNSTIYPFTYSAFSYTEIYAYWYQISDEILPFLIMATMLAFTSLTVQALVKRHMDKKRHRQPISSAARPRIDVQKQQMRTATKLLVASTSLCVLNQIGMISYTVGWQVFDNTVVTFASSYERVTLWLDRRQAYNCCYVLQGICENVSHMMHFYVYAGISAKFRAEFVNKIRRHPALGKSTVTAITGNTAGVA